MVSFTLYPTMSINGTDRNTLIQNHIFKPHSSFSTFTRRNPFFLESNIIKIF